MLSNRISISSASNAHITGFGIINIRLPRVAGVGDALDTALRVADLQRPQGRVRLSLRWNKVNRTLKMVNKPIFIKDDIFPLFNQYLPSSRSSNGVDDRPLCHAVVVVVVLLELLSDPLPPPPPFVLVVRAVDAMQECRHRRQLGRFAPVCRFLCDST